MPYFRPSYAEAVRSGGDNRESAIQGLEARQTNVPQWHSDLSAVGMESDEATRRKLDDDYARRMTAIDEREAADEQRRLGSAENALKLERLAPIDDLLESSKGVLQQDETAQAAIARGEPGTRVDADRMTRARETIGQRAPHVRAEYGGKRVSVPQRGVGALTHGEVIGMELKRAAMKPPYSLNDQLDYDKRVGERAFQQKLSEKQAQIAARYRHLPNGAYQKAMDAELDAFVEAEGRQHVGADYVKWLSPEKQANLRARNNPVDEATADLIRGVTPRRATP